MRGRSRGTIRGVRLFGFSFLGISAYAIQSSTVGDWSETSTCKDIRTAKLDRSLTDFRSTFVFEKIFKQKLFGLKFNLFPCCLIWPKVLTKIVRDRHKKKKNNVFLLEARAWLGCFESQFSTYVTRLEQVFRFLGRWNKIVCSLSRDLVGWKLTYGLQLLLGRSTSLCQFSSGCHSRPCVWD